MKFLLAMAAAAGLWGLFEASTGEAEQASATPLAGFYKVAHFPLADYR